MALLETNGPGNALPATAREFATALEKREVSAASGERQYVVVRRFGKAQGSSHYSALGSDGICWPTRLKDIQGTVVESMWVCCNDDSECRAQSMSDCTADASSSQGGINTVVADPDDEIFCDICHLIDSWSYNQIVICDGCERGVHQICHAPIVTEDELTQDSWFCESCTQQAPKKATKRIRSQ
ncbi:mitochondrial transcription factor 2 [Coemansia sp. RSA 2320]|nr:mitochondrial transcription factor 2 [Coemansia sp. RSA 2320]